MKILTRIIWLCLIAFAASWVVIVAQMKSGSRCFDIVYHGTSGGDQSHLTQLIELDRRSIDSFTYDLTFRDDLVEFVHAIDVDFGDENIKYSLDTYGLDVGWVFNADMEQIYSASLLEQELLKEFPLLNHILVDTFSSQRFPHFFMHTPGGLLEVFVASIHPSNDEARRTAPHGFLLVGRIWDGEQLDYLSSLSGASVRVNYPDATVRSGDAPEGDVRVNFPLQNWAGDVVASLDFELSHQFLEDYAKQQEKRLIPFAVFLLLLVGLISVCLHYWIIKPLRKISLSLKEHSAIPLDGLNAKQNEFGKIAEHIVQALGDQGELKQAKELADRAAGAKSRFLRNLSHELKTPLNGIIGAAQILEVTEMSDEQNEFLEIINSCGENLNDLISELLTLTEVEDGSYEVEKAPFDLFSLIRELDGYGGQMAHERGLDFRVDYEQNEFPTVLLGDVSCVKEVLLHLLRNAFKFTEQGDVSLYVKLIASDSKQALVRFSVVDTGMGIPKEIQGSLMEAFAQGEDSDARSYDGLGIGLAIVHALTLAMAGALSFASEERKGSTFSVELPLHKVSA